MKCTDPEIIIKKICKDIFYQTICGISSNSNTKPFTKKNYFNSNTLLLLTSPLDLVLPFNRLCLCESKLCLAPQMIPLLTDCLIFVVRFYFAWFYFQIKQNDINGKPLTLVTLTSLGRTLTACNRHHCKHRKFHGCMLLSWRWWLLSLVF